MKSLGRIKDIMVGVWSTALLLSGCATPVPYVPDQHQPPSFDDAVRMVQSYKGVICDIHTNTTLHYCHGFNTLYSVDKLTVTADTLDVIHDGIVLATLPLNSLTFEINESDGQLTLDHYWELMVPKNRDDFITSLIALKNRYADSWTQLLLFNIVADAYRSLAIKPGLPEDARRLKVQAEDAIEKKDFASAAGLFKQAIRIAPWWPEGHFNCALVLGEIDQPAAAILEMSHYLALVPSAPNARLAQDKIYVWERKAPNTLESLKHAPSPPTVSPIDGKPLLGVSIANVPEIVGEALARPNLQGALILAVAPGSVAEVAGLHAGDVVVAVGNSPIEKADDLITAIRGIQRQCGTLVPISALRNSEMLQLSASFCNGDGLKNLPRPAN